MKLVLASLNPHKLQELQGLFAPLGVELVNQGDVGVAEAEEPYLSFVENALAKARHAAHHSGMAAIADDSGICVNTLGGAPGVMSARYATLFGKAKSDENNNLVLLENLQGNPDRRARFVCALVAVRHAKDPEPLITMGRWDGHVTQQLRGTGGFGYDPLMRIATLGKTVAELTREEKNQYSHRAQAVRGMLPLMQAAWHMS
jgi:XTP/dITP diphosphohydrolase